MSFIIWALCCPKYTTFRVTSMCGGREESQAEMGTLIRWEQKGGTIQRGREGEEEREREADRDEDFTESLN